MKPNAIGRLLHYLTETDKDGEYDVPTEQAMEAAKELAEYLNKDCSVPIGAMKGLSNHERGLLVASAVEEVIAAGGG